MLKAGRSDTVVPGHNSSSQFNSVSCGYRISYPERSRRELDESDMILRHKQRELRHSLQGRILKEETVIWRT